MDKRSGGQNGVDHSCRIEYRKMNEKKNEDSQREVWDNIKHINVHIIVVPEGEEREKGPEKILEEVIAETSLTWERK